MKLLCLFFFISVSINACVGGNNGEGSKSKQKRVESSNFFTAIVRREKEGSMSKKNLLSAMDLESRREHQRLVKIYTQAVDEKWNYDTRGTGGNIPFDTPVILTLGVTAEGTFIQFCIGALVKVEDGLYIVVTSAICAYEMDEIESQGNVNIEDPTYLGQPIYHHPYSSGHDPNIAIYKMKMPVSPFLQVLQLPSDDDRTVNGTVAWRAVHYENRHHVDAMPGEAFAIPGEIVDSPDSKMFRVKTNSNKRTIPERDLGGSLFYVRNTQGRPVLKGIRTLLTGDYFTAIAPFADWIRNQTREMQLESRMSQMRLAN